MEEFFKQPILEILYNSLATDFERNILNENTKGKEYCIIEAQKDKLYNTLKALVGSNKEKLNNLFKIMRELEQCYYKEIEYWNKEYFKLGFTYMVALENPNNFIRLERDNFSLKVHSFLDRLRVNNIDKNKKMPLINFINNLEKGTEKQKKRFLMYYNLMPDNNKILNYSDISKSECCSISAIKSSVISIVSYLVRLEDSQKSLFLAIMNSISI